jgi:hypothetical protein
VLLCAVVGAVTLAACEPPYLTWTPREPLAARRGHVAVSVEDRRPGDLAKLGRAFGWAGAPRDILVDRDHVRARIERLTKEATVTAGLGLWTPAEAPSARLRVSVDALSCDGTRLDAHATLLVHYSIHDADGSQRLAPQTVTTTSNGHGCELAFEHALDTLMDELSSAFVEGPVHDALVPPPVEAPAI